MRIWNLGGWRNTYDCVHILCLRVGKQIQSAHEDTSAISKISNLRSRKEVWNHLLMSNFFWEPEFNGIWWNRSHVSSFLMIWRHFILGFQIWMKFHSHQGIEASESPFCLSWQTKYPKLSLAASWALCFLSFFCA